MSGSIPKAMSFELEFGKHGVNVLVVVAGATLSEGKDDVVDGRLLLPNDALGTTVVAGSKAMSRGSMILSVSLSCISFDSTSVNSQRMGISKTDNLFSLH